MKALELRSLLHRSLYVFGIAQQTRKRHYDSLIECSNLKKQLLEDSKEELLKSFNVIEAAETWFSIAHSKELASKEGKTREKGFRVEYRAGYRVR